MLPIILTVLAFTLQDPQGTEQKKPASAEVGALKNRIRDMRSNLLLGGDDVRHAEAEAADFYKGKIEQVDLQIDKLSAEKTELRASYDLALGRTLDSNDEKERVFAMREASRLRARIASIAKDEATFSKQRRGLQAMVDGVGSRERERQKLSAQLDSFSDPSQSAGLAVMGVGLAPEAETGTKEASFYLDEGFISDLMARDPRRARAVLFDADPIKYWLRFPLQPPGDALKQALAFPAPDLPGMR